MDSKDDVKQVKELYYPRKCSATGRLIGAKDHASVQINVGQVDQDGLYTKEYSTFALCGYIRFKSRGDTELNRLVASAGLMKSMDSFPRSETFEKKKSSDE